MFKKIKRILVQEEDDEGLRLYFPEQDIKKLYFLLDEAHKLDTRTSKYELWVFIYETLGLEIINDHVLKTDDIMNPYVVVKR